MDKESLRKKIEEIVQSIKIDITGNVVKAETQKVSYNKAIDELLTLFPEQPEHKSIEENKPIDFKKKYYALVDEYGKFYDQIIRDVIDHIEMWSDEGGIKTTEDIVKRLEQMKNMGKMNCGIEGGITEPHLNSRNLLELLAWLHGYTDFPERKAGDGAYWWRKELTKRMEAVGITHKMLDEFIESEKH